MKFSLRTLRGPRGAEGSYTFGMGAIPVIALLLTLVGCEGEYPLLSSLSQSHLSMIAITDADQEMERPALKDSLNKREDTGAAPTTEVKPVGTVNVDVWAKGCTLCNKLKKDIEGYKGLKFEFKIVPDSETVPVLRWKAAGRTWTQVGWEGLPAFIRAYNASLKPQARSGYQSQTSLDGNFYPPRESLIEHLHETHRHSRKLLAAMSYDSLLKLHDKDHE